MEHAKGNVHLVKKRKKKETFSPIHRNANLKQ